MVLFLIVRVDIGMVAYEAYDTKVWEVSGSGPGCQCGYSSGDL